MDRPAYLAGSWYPGTEELCRQAVEDHASTLPAGGLGAAAGLVAPHAGWVYSGDAAGQGFRALAEGGAEPDLLIVFGSHRGPDGPSTVFRGEGWSTPLGRFATARDLAERVAEDLGLPDEPVRPARPDNAVEVQLPMARAFFARAELLMVGVAAAPVAIRIGCRVGEIVREAGRRAVVIGSTDLTHYGAGYGFAPKGRGEAAVRWVRETNDRGFLDRVLAGDEEGLLEHAVRERSACCPGAVAATLASLRALGARPRPRLVAHYLSHDVRPAPDFVGYGTVLL